jgi:hypothetical protein
MRDRDLVGVSAKHFDDIFRPDFPLAQDWYMEAGALTGRKAFDHVGHPPQSWMETET